MVADSPFDVVSKVDRQGVNSALNQAAREVSQHFGFKNADSSIHWFGDAIEIESSGKEHTRVVLDVFQSKLIKRGVPLKTLDVGEPRISGRKWKIACITKQGIRQEDAKKVSKLMRDEGPKDVKVQIRNDKLRISSRSCDHLQEVQRLIKKADCDLAVRFANYR